MINNFQLRIETEAGITEVTQPVQETVTGKLNRLAREAGYDNISPNAIETIGWEGDETATTVVFNRNQDEPYTLTPVIAGRIKVYNREGRYRVPDDYRGVVGLHRAYVGYMAASRINSVTDMKTTLQPIINLGIMDLINQFGTLGLGYKISMAMPGYEPTYFRDLDDRAAYEIRLILTKE